MVTAEFWCEHERGEAARYFVYLYQWSLGAATRRAFLLWLDPYCRRPWWLWRPLWSLWERETDARPTAKVEVSEEWARANFDWSVDELDRAS